MERQMDGRTRVVVKVGIYTGKSGFLRAVMKAEKSHGVALDGEGALSTLVWFRPDEIEEVPRGN